MKTRQYVLVVIVLVGSWSGSFNLLQASEKADDSTFTTSRLEMVQTQLISRGISDKRMLAAMKEVPRHLFVSGRLQSMAYLDRPLPIEAGQTISQPYIVALMTELIELEGDEKVLEIGTGSGYQAAILGELADEVYTIEIIDTLANSARRLLDDLGYTNITVRNGDGYKGWSEEAPFDAIIVTAAPAEIPKPLLEQLAEGGRLVIPVGTHWQELKLVVKTDGKLTTTSIIPVRFVPMTGEAEKDN